MRKAREWSLVAAMNVKATVFVGISLDGFLARKNGDIDWLTGSGEDGGADEAAGADDHGFKAFFDTVDVLVMGRNTYEKVLTFEKWYYGDKPVVVLTTRPLEIPQRIAATVEVMSGTPGKIVERLAARGAKHLYIDGGITIQQFLGAGLIDRMVLSRLPVLIGTGIPLFGPLPRDVKWRLVSTKECAGGMVQSEYEMVQGRGDDG
jgi:dihydrofolate reductase